MTAQERPVLAGFEDESDGIYCLDCKTWSLDESHDGHAVAPAVEHGDYIVNPATGEVLGLLEDEALAGDDGLFHVTDRPSAEWVMERIFEAYAEVAALERRKRIILANLEDMAKVHERRAMWLERRFSAELEAWARSELEKKKGRTVKTPFGVLRFRKKPGRVVIVDEQTAKRYARDYHSEALKVEERLLISKLALPDDFFEHVAPEVSGLAWEGESETFAIVPGSGKEQLS